MWVDWSVLSNYRIVCALFFAGMAVAFFVVGLVCLAIWIKRKVTERKNARAEVERRIVYTLPDRDNSYVRTRLNTTLYVKSGETEVEPAPMKLGYARELLNGIKNAPLTVAERLQAEEMGAMLSVLVHKEEWSLGDVRCANDLCASLLKLSAKYAV